MKLCGQKRISKSALLILAADRSFACVFAFIFIWDLILTVFFMLGGMMVIEYFLAIVLIDIGIFAFAVQSSLRVKCGWNNLGVMRRLLKNRKLIESLSGIALAYQNNRWQYIDRDWFIRVNSYSSCILFAPELDFAKPGRSEKLRIYDDFARKRIHAPFHEANRYTFHTFGDSFVTIQTDKIDLLYKWITEHGGRIVLEQ